MCLFYSRIRCQVPNGSNNGVSRRCSFRISKKSLHCDIVCHHAICGGNFIKITLSISTESFELKLLGFILIDVDEGELVFNQKFPEKVMLLWLYLLGLLGLLAEIP